MKSSVKLTLIIIFSVFLLLLPNLLRTHSTKLGGQTYFYERISDLVDKEDKLPIYDELSYGGREFIYDLGPVYSFLFLKNVFGLNFTLNVSPILLGALTLILFYLLLKRFNLENNENYIGMVLLAMSSMFLFIFTSYNEDIITIPLVLLTFYLFTSKNNFAKNTSLILLFLLGLFSYKAVILLLFAMLFYLVKEKRLKEFYLPLLISLISFLLFNLKRILLNGFVSTSFKENYFKVIINELGGSYGISLFLLFLTLFGLRYLWKSKYKYTHIYVITLSFTILTLIDHEFIIYFNFLIIYLSAVGLNHLLKSPWDSELIRKLTITLLLIGVIFSSYTSLNYVKDSQPNDQLTQALGTFRSEGDPSEIVLSHYSYGFFINKISGKTVYISQKFTSVPDFKQRYSDMQTIFYSRNADETNGLLNYYNIKYILITKDMKEGLVWDDVDEGLLFVLENSKEFKMIIKNDYAEVWKIK